jgi:hypothetical protein
VWRRLKLPPQVRKTGPLRPLKRSMPYRAVRCCCYRANFSLCLPLLTRRPGVPPGLDKARGCLVWLLQPLARHTSQAPKNRGLRL